jgi:energy-coupling factor transporter ATP-binding protein EcfA2
MQTIDIIDVGAIQHLTIPLAPGVLVLQGRNGSGKSTALRAIGALATGEATDLEVRDEADEDARGRVSGLGAQISIGRRRAEATELASGKNRSTGELEIRTLRGLNPLDLVNPGIADPERADARRIALLCDLAQVKGGIGMFVEALGATVKQYASRKTLDAASVPEIANGLRRDLQTAARDVELSVAKLDGEIQAHLSASDGVDPVAPADTVDIAAELAKALRASDALAAKAEQSKRARAAAEQARAELERARAEFSGPTLEQADASIAETQEKLTHLAGELERIRSEQRDTQTVLAGLQAQRTAAVQHARNMEAWGSSIGLGEQATTVSTDELRAAEDRVLELQRAQASAAVLAEKRRRRREADGLINKRDKARAESDDLRSLAGRCEAVVSEIINRSGLGLRVRNGRLVLNTARGETLLADLSFGEGVRLAVEIAAKSFGSENALLVVPQEAFEGLDPKNRTELDAIARELGVAIVTAHATAGDLAAVPFSNGQDSAEKVA